MTNFICKNIIIMKLSKIKYLQILSPSKSTKQLQKLLVVDTQLIQTFGIQQVVYKVLVLLVSKLIVSCLANSIVFISIESRELVYQGCNSVVRLFRMETIALIVFGVVYDDGAACYHQIHPLVLDGCIYQWNYGRQIVIFRVLILILFDTLYLIWI